MKKVHILWLALVAVFAVGAVGATSAFALTFEEAEFLINGAMIENKVPPVTQTGELLLKDTGTGAGVICSGTFEGTIDSPKDLLISTVLDLNGNTIGELTGTGVKCKSASGCAENTDIEVWPLNLPWLFEPMLDIEEKTPWLLILQHTGAAGLPSWHVKCLILGITAEDECEAVSESGGEASNVAGGVEGVGNVEPLGTCSVGGTNTGEIKSAGTGTNLTSSTEGKLSISMLEEP